MLTNGFFLQPGAVRIVSRIQALDAQAARIPSSTRDPDSLENPTEAKLTSIWAKQADLGMQLATILFGKSYMQGIVLESNTPKNSSSSQHSHRTHQVRIQSCFLLYLQMKS